MQENQNNISKYTKISEFISLGAFLIAFIKYDIFIATATLMVASTITALVILIKFRTLERMHLFLVSIILIFGTMTLYFQDPAFIKMKPTLMLGAMGVIAIISVYIKKPILMILIPNQKNQNLTKQHMQILTLNFGIFYCILAILNEIVWRTQSDQFWVYFKVFGVIGLTILFMAAHIPWLIKISKTQKAKTQDKSELIVKPKITLPKKVTPSKNKPKPKAKNKNN